jgi:hypothetical protein
VLAILARNTGMFMEEQTFHDIKYHHDEDIDTTLQFLLTADIIEQDEHLGETHYRMCDTQESRDICDVMDVEMTVKRTNE